jgi:hypothetical protein
MGSSLRLCDLFDPPPRRGWQWAEGTVLNLDLDFRLSQWSDWTTEMTVFTLCCIFSCFHYFFLGVLAQDKCSEVVRLMTAGGDGIN